MTKAPSKVRENIMSEDRAVESKQRLRLRRFGMALFTYAVVILATVLVTLLGLGEMNVVQ